MRCLRTRRSKSHKGDTRTWCRTRNVNGCRMQSDIHSFGCRGMHHCISYLGRTFSLLCKIGSTLYYSHDIISLREEREPVVQHLLLAIRQIGPFRRDILGLRARLPQSTGGIVTGKYCASLLGKWVALVVAAKGKNMQCRPGGVSSAQGGKKKRGQKPHEQRVDGP